MVSKLKQIPVLCILYVFLFGPQSLNSCCPYINLFYTKHSDKVEEMWIFLMDTGVQCIVLRYNHNKGK